MEKVEKKIDEQLQFWSVIGPFMTLLTVVVCLTKGSPVQSAYAIIGLMGIPLCLRWKKQGMMLSLVLLAAIYVYQLTALSLALQIWSAGLFASFALSFFVTALSLEEGTHIVTGILADSHSRLDQVKDLDEKVRTIESELENVRSQSHAKVHAIEVEASQLKEKLDRSQTLVDAAQQELASLYNQNKVLLEELFDLRSRPIPVAVPPEELNLLRKKFEQEEERALTLEIQLEEKVAAAQQLTAQCDLKSEEVIRQHAAFSQELVQLRQENEELREKQEKVASSAAKKETAAYRKLQGMYKQLKEQFEEKCEILDETRRAQFHMQERLFNAQREVEEKQRNDVNEAEAALQLHLKKMEEERLQLEKAHTDEVEALQQIITSLSIKCRA